MEGSIEMEVVSESSGSFTGFCETQINNNVPYLSAFNSMDTSLIFNPSLCSTWNNAAMLNEVEKAWKVWNISADLSTDTSVSSGNHDVSMISSKSWDKSDELSTSTHYDPA